MWYFRIDCSSGPLEFCSTNPLMEVKCVKRILTPNPERRMYSIDSFWQTQRRERETFRMWKVKPQKPTGSKLQFIWLSWRRKWLCHSKRQHLKLFLSPSHVIIIQARFPFPFNSLANIIITTKVKCHHVPPTN